MRSGIMTALPRVAIVLAAFAATHANGQSCGKAVASATEKDAFTDRSWINSNAVIYGASSHDGIFRLRLGSNQQTQIGSHAAHTLYDFKMSPRREWLFYFLDEPSRGQPTYWLYNVTTEEERQLRSVPKYSSDFVFSPDETKIAWTPRPGDPDAVYVATLSTFETRSFPLHLSEPSGSSTLLGLAWSDNGDRVLFGQRPRDGRETFWSLDPIFGRLSPVTGQREGRPETGDLRIRYSENGIAIGADCILCGRPRGVSDIELLGGAQASVKQRRQLIVTKPGSGPKVVAEIPTEPQPEPTISSDGTQATVVALGCMTHSLALLGSIDDRYIIYDLDQEYWVYGAIEDRKAQLTNRPGTFLVW